MISFCSPAEQDLLAQLSCAACTGSFICKGSYAACYESTIQLLDFDDGPKPYAFMSLHAYANVD